MIRLEGFDLSDTRAAEHSRPVSANNFDLLGYCQLGAALIFVNPTTMDATGIISGTEEK